MRLIVSFWVAGNALLLACSCAPFPAPRPCEPNLSADAIFVGKVVRVVSTATSDAVLNYEFDPNIRVELDVSESFRGAVENQRVEVVTDNSTCGVAFAIGKTYLVYARRRNKSDPLRVHLCGGGAAELSASGDYLDALRRLKSGQGPSQIYGFVTTDKNEFQYAPEGRAGAVRGITVRLHSPQTSERPLETQTDGNGRYEFSDLKGGQAFDVEFLVPDLAQISRRRKVEVPAGGCSRLNFLVGN